MMEEIELIDTHAHIYYDDLYTNIEQVLNQCDEVGVKRIYMPNVDSGSIAPMLDLSERFPEQCIPMIGLHPCNVKEDYKTELNLVESWLSKREFKAVGEIGIDYYWSREYDAIQEEAFVFQLDLALKHDLPVSIHSRDSLDAVISILEGRHRPVRGILHCFTGSLEQANKLIQLGLFLGIGGVVTFKNAGLDKVVEQLNLDNIVLETDSPYLSPVPYRGKPNSPVYLRVIAEKIAGLHKRHLHEVATITTANARKIFK
jgi:TatD DNase family protein